MKRLATTIVGLSLFVGSAFAQDGFGFQSFYPAQEDDTPSYLIDNSKVMPHQTLAKSSIKSSTLSAFYLADGDDTPSYLVNNDNIESNKVTSIAKSSIKHCTLASFYLEEGVDSPRANITC